jgi:hypothetical protein
MTSLSATISYFTNGPPIAKHLSYTRHLYQRNMVEMALVSAVLKQNDLQECYFWLAELYYSVKGEDRFFVMFQFFWKIYWDFYYTVQPDFVDYLYQMESVCEYANADADAHADAIGPYANIIFNFFIAKSNPVVFLLRQMVQVRLLTDLDLDLDLEETVLTMSFHSKLLEALKLGQWTQVSKILAQTRPYAFEYDQVFQQLYGHHFSFVLPSTLIDPSLRAILLISRCHYNTFPKDEESGDMNIDINMNIDMDLQYNNLLCIPEHVRNAFHFNKEDSFISWLEENWMDWELTALTSLYWKNKLEDKNNIYFSTEDSHAYFYADVCDLFEKHNSNEAEAEVEVEDDPNLISNWLYWTGFGLKVEEESVSIDEGVSTDEGLSLDEGDGDGDEDIVSDEPQLDVDADGDGDAHIEPCWNLETLNVALDIGFGSIGEPFRSVNYKFFCYS